tara:strand:+ start:1703 stop:4423 length:2721 start_codon:yes stop_codon:yes gene_type:complete
MKKKIINYFLIFYFIVTFILAVIFGVIFFKSDYIQGKKNLFISKIFNSGRFEYIYLPKILFKSAVGQFKKIDQLYLNISFENLLTLEASRSAAIKNFKEENFDSKIFKETTMNIVQSDKKYSGRIRLKGDRDIHWRNKKNSSYKINLKKNNYIFNMNKFSLQKPRARNYIHEWIYLKLAKENNLIAIDYRFIELNLNGEKMGLYVMEEGFDKDLLEKNGRRNGPIFSLNETYSVDQSQPVLEIYNEKFWLSKDNLEIYKKAKINLEKYFKKEIEAEDVFDLKKWATFFAITDLTHTYHGLYAKSVKFYFNPVSNLFEPIPFDGHRKKPNYSKYSKSYDNRILLDILLNPKTNAVEHENFWLWTKNFFFKFDDTLKQSFYTMYLNELNNISENTYMQKFFENNNSKINFINSKIYSDFFLYDDVFSYGPGLYYFNKNDYYSRSQIIKKKIESSDIVLAIENENTNEVVVTNDFPKLYGATNLKYGELNVKNIICQKRLQQQDKYLKIDKNINYFKNIKIKINKEYKNRCNFLLLINSKNEEIIVKINKPNSLYLNKKSTLTGNLDEFFIRKKNNLYLRKKNLILTKSVFIPKNLTLNILPGEKLNIIDNSFLLSKSSIKAICTSKQPCYIGGKKNNFGGGLLFSGDKNVLKNVNFSYLSGLRKNLNFNDKVISINTKYTLNNSYKNEINYKKELNNKFSSYLLFGAINFNQTFVSLENVNIEKIYSEDAINIINSTFEFKEVAFLDIYSDAIDVDTGTGSLQTIKFNNIKNDAIDFSNSDVTATNLSFINVGDKMVSAGENSTIKLNKIVGKNSYIGIASKDGSITLVEDINLENVLIPYASYQKKKLYKPGSLKINNQITKNFLTIYLKDKNSKIEIDNDRMQRSNNKFFEIIYKKNLEHLTNYKL